MSKTIVAPNATLLSGWLLKFGGGAEFYMFAFTDHKKQFNFKRNKNDEYI